MISLQIQVVDTELVANLERLPQKLHEAVRLKMDEEVSALRLKVLENLSGKVLNSKSGALASALVSGVDEIGTNLLVGFVAIESSDTKVMAYAHAHEYGGKGFYEIIPVQKLILRFESKSGEIVFAPYVFHPPQAERSYLRSALHEMAPEIENQINLAIQAQLD